ncbi:MAG: aldo/keto reductase, partial [Firmicutes bacterium]|nr:aldo/keto reductase [Bacillota bacterium]
ELADLALRFTLSQDITAAIPPGEAKLFRMALNIAEDFRPLDDNELAQLKSIAQGVTPVFVEHPA